MMFRGRLFLYCRLQHKLDFNPGLLGESNAFYLKIISYSSFTFPLKYIYEKKRTLDNLSTYFYHFFRKFLVLCV